MKILLINKFHYLAGGAERYVFEWAKLLRERGHEVAHFAMRHPRNAPCEQERFFVEETTFFDEASLWSRMRAGLRAIYSFEAGRKLARLLAELRPDIAHLHSFCYQLTPSILRSLARAGVPVVQTSHEYKHVCANQHLYDAWGGRICERCKGGRHYMPIFTRCINGSSVAGALGCAESCLDRMCRLSERVIQRIITPSDFMRRKFLEFGVSNESRPARGGTTDRIVHIPNFVNPSEWSPRVDSEPYLLYVGRLVRHKGILTLVRAMGRMPDCRLLIAGEGPLRGDIQAQAARSRAENVEMVGWKDGQELRNLIQRCRGLMAPSEWYENCPFVVLEGMAAGRPVIGSRIGGIPELIEDGESGLLHEPGDVDQLVAAVRRVWHNPGEAGRLGRAARERVEHLYSSDRHYGEVMNQFQALVT